MAKVISSRLKMVLRDIIHITQTSFIENQRFVNNVITFWEYSTWPEEQDADLAVCYSTSRKHITRSRENSWK